MEPIFQLENIKFKNILDIEKLNIPRNKITCILGESGSGKTTLLRMLNCLISPEAGEIFFQGENIKQMDAVELRRKVVMLGQTPVTFPGTIQDNLHMALRFSDKEVLGEEKLKKYLNMVSLNKSLEQFAESLSGGEKQRLALARVLILEPEVLLLDEPSSALDEETEKLVIEKVTNYAKKNHKTLVMVTHARKIAEDYGENIIKVSQGKVLEGGE